MTHRKRCGFGEGLGDRDAAAAEDVGVRQAARVRHGVDVIGERSANVVNRVADEDDRPVPDALPQHLHVFRKGLLLAPGGRACASVGPQEQGGDAQAGDVLGQEGVGAQGQY